MREIKVNKKVRLILAAMILILAGCSKKEKTALDAKNPTTITLWHYYVSENQQALERSVLEFNQTIGMEKGIIVDLVAKGSIAKLEEAVTKSATGTINAEPMPDIFSSYADKAMEIDALGMLCDLNTYFTPADKALYIEEFLADGLFGGDRLLLVPVVKSTELLYVNATAWEEYAQAEQLDDTSLSTWESIYDTAKAYYEWSDGKALLGFDSLANYIIIGNKQLGVDVIDSQGEQAILDRTVLRRLFDVYYKGYSLGYFDALGKFRSDDIKSGHLVAYVGSSSSAAYFPTWIEKDNSQVDIDFASLPYPVFDGGSAYAIQQGAGMCVAKTSPAKEEGAAIFLKWFTDKEQNIPFSMTSGYLPVQKDAYTSPNFQAVLDSLASGDAAQQNVADVYSVALHQITESKTYAAKPFIGSYGVRSVLQSTLDAIAKDGRIAASELRQKGFSETEILTTLDIDHQFENWLNNILDNLSNAEISFKE